MTNCANEWIGFYRWWCQIGPSGQAAWVQAIGSILAIVAAILIPYFQRRSDRRLKSSNDRKIVMSAATNLSVALDYATFFLALTPTGDGVIGHNFTLEQAHEFLKLRPETHEALKAATANAVYFEDKLCEQIVLLSIDAAAYEQLIAAYYGKNVDAYFDSVRGGKDKIAGRMNIVRALLKPYLPQSS